MDKRYEEALERAKMILCNLSEGSSSVRDIETIFPELAESEDEKKRKRVIECLKLSLKGAEDQNDAGSDRTCDIEALKWGIAYLEKQKERGPLTKEEEYTLQRIIEQLEDEGCPQSWKDLLYDIYNLPYEKQKEQQPVPALDRGDEIILKAICEELKDAPGWVERIQGWYSLAKDAQQPAERSEGDERIRKNICRIVKEHMRHCAEAGIEIGDHREALQYLEKQKEQKAVEEQKAVDEIGKSVRKKWAIDFIRFLDEHRYEGKMCVSNGECLDIENAFISADWEKLIRYYNKYAQKPAEWSEEDDEVRTNRIYLKGYNDAVRNFSWKPTEEQMKDLFLASREGCDAGSPVAENLKSIYDALQKFIAYDTRRD